MAQITPHLPNTEIWLHVGTRNKAAGISKLATLINMRPFTATKKCGKMELSSVLESMRPISSPKTQVDTGA